MTSKRHTRIITDERHIWSIARLRKLAANLSPVEVELSSIPDLEYDCWFAGKPPSIKELAPHIERVIAADLNFPIILDADGRLMDGGHRCCKALIEGRRTIQALKFDQTPDPDEIQRLG